VTVLLALLLSLPPGDPAWAVEELIDPTLGFLTIHDLAGPCIPPLLPRISIDGMETSLLDPSVLSLGPFRRIVFKSRALDFEPAQFDEDQPLTVLGLGRGSERVTELGGTFGRGFLGGRFALQAGVDYREIAPLGALELDYQHSYSTSLRYHSEPWLLSGFVLATDREHPALNLKNNYFTTMFVASLHDYSISLGYGRDRGTHPFEEVLGHAEADIGPLTATLKGRRIWAMSLEDDRITGEISGWFYLGDLKVRPAVHYAHSEMFDGGPGASLTVEGFRSRIEAFYGKRFPQLTMLTNDAESWIFSNSNLFEETVLELNARFGMGLPVFLDVLYLQGEDLIIWSWSEEYINQSDSAELFELRPGLDFQLPLGLEISASYVLRSSDDLRLSMIVAHNGTAKWFRESDGHAKLTESIPLKSGDLMFSVYGELLYFGPSDFADHQSLLNAGASMNFFESVNVSFELWNLTDEMICTNELYPLTSRRYTVRVSAQLWD
jgi:hypothetical protein